jgi:hypothetical protein
MGTISHLVGSQHISRRGFLKLGGLGIAAALGIRFPLRVDNFQLLNSLNNRLGIPLLALSQIDFADVLNPNQQGRVLDSTINIYDKPSLNGNLVRTYWRDWVLPITAITIGKSEDSFNMVWYKVGEEAYAHSGSIQPVLTITNPIVTQIPPEGALAELTVPFTDARWDPGEDKQVAYRFYYATTYWVMETVQDAQGNSWYGIRDDKWEYMFYVPATHLRIIPNAELNPISPNVPMDMKRIEVHLPEQVMIAYEYDQPIFMTRIASGAIFSNGDFSTPSGRYMTFHKRYSRHMARGNLAANGYDLPGVPWNAYITEEGIAFHGTYWHNNFGKPRSHGCINLTTQAAKWVYLWTMPAVPPDEEGLYKKFGTSVDIID